jgi:hypothetical protein
MWILSCKIKSIFPPVGLFFARGVCKREVSSQEEQTSVSAKVYQRTNLETAKHANAREIAEQLQCLMQSNQPMPQQMHNFPRSRDFDDSICWTRINQSTRQLYPPVSIRQLFNGMRLNPSLKSPARPERGVSQPSRRVVKRQVPSMTTEASPIAPC